VHSRPLAGLQLLVIDDEPDNLDLLTFLLQEEGATVIAVATAQEALDVLEHSQPHVILCDLILPDLNGCELIQQWRDREAELARPLIPAIAVTGLDRELYTLHELEASFQGYILKPFDVKQVSDMVTSVAFGGAWELRIRESELGK
jgi:CheY-like chemotaxis protein